MSQSKKIVMLGHFGVGKTSLVRQFVDSAFSEDYLVTIGVQVKKKSLIVDGQPIDLIIWDIEGNMSLTQARKSYMLGAHGFIYVFDVTRPETFENLTDELQFLATHYPDVPREVVGNKTDLIVKDRIKDFFDQDAFAGCVFTSAKTSDNVEAVFEALSKNMM